MSRVSRIALKSSTASLDEDGKPVFGTVRSTKKTPTKKEERRETAKREYPTLEQHVAYLQLLGYDPIWVPGTPEYIKTVTDWIEKSRPYTMSENRQVEHWRKELQLCQAMKQPQSPAN